jgi:FkbM family methyltransferase
MRRASTAHSGFRFWGHRVEVVGIKGLLESDGVTHAESKVTPPSEMPYQLGSPDKRSYSQWGQDLLLQPILSKLGKGFFVEAGALDGESDSNSLFYEKLGWTGLLVEPNPENTKKILGKHRKAYFFQGCLSPTPYEQTLRFESNHEGNTGTSALSDSGSYQVLGKPLQDLLQSIGRKTVDFLSLDVEGSEASVLHATDFSKVELGVLLVEANKSPVNNAGIKEVMDKEGFVNIGHTNYDGGQLDQIYVNPKYFSARGLATPTAADLPAENRNS